MKKIFPTLLIICLCINASAFAFEFKNPFSKKSKQTVEKMVETKQEWEEKAININLENRYALQYEAPQDKDFKPKLAPQKRFVKYNMPPGTQEADFTKIKREKDIKSAGVIDSHFKYLAYAQYYYSPAYDQISSELYVQELGRGATRIRKVLNTTTLNAHRSPLISVGMEQLQNHMFQTLTIVDFSPDSKKLLVKEKVGSSTKGIFRNYVWVCFLDGENSGAIKFGNLNEEIKRRYKEKTGLALDNYRWDIKPLGFYNEDSDIVIVEAFVWDNNQKQIFLGVWGINCLNSTLKLISEQPTPLNISASGLVVKEFLP